MYCYGVTEKLKLFIYPFDVFMEFKYSTTVDHSMVTVIVSCCALVLKYLRVLAYISALRSIYGI